MTNNVVTTKGNKRGSRNTLDQFTVSANITLWYIPNLIEKTYQSVN